MRRPLLLHWIATLAALLGLCSAFLPWMGMSKDTLMGALGITWNGFEFWQGYSVFIAYILGFSIAVLSWRGQMRARIAGTGLCLVAGSVLALLGHYFWWLQQPHYQTIESTFQMNGGPIHRTVRQEPITLIAGFGTWTAFGLAWLLLISGLLMLVPDRKIPAAVEPEILE